MHFFFFEFAVYAVLHGTIISVTHSLTLVKATYEENLLNCLGTTGVQSWMTTPPTHPPPQKKNFVIQNVLICYNLETVFPIMQYHWVDGWMITPPYCLYSGSMHRLEETCN
jgi:hypothetical protein